MSAIKLLKSAVISLAVGISAFPAYAEDVTELKWVMWGGGGADGDVWRHLASLVSEEHPDLKVSVEFIPWGDYWTKLPILSASGQIGDIVTMQNLRLPNFHQVMDPLTPYIERDGFDTSVFTAAALNAMTLNDDVYALSFGLGPTVMFYNKDIFEAGGVDVPEFGWTWDDFVKTAQALKGDGIYGAGAISSFLGNSRATGVSYIGEDGGLDLSDPALTDMMADLAMLAKDEVMPIVSAGVNVESFNRGLFDNGTAAMYVDGPWALLSKNNEEINFTYGLLPLPGPADGSGAQTPIGTSGFGVAAASDKKEAAWRAVQVLSGEKALLYLAAQGRALPSRTALRDIWYNLAASEVENANAALNYTLDRAVSFDVTDNWNEVVGLFGQYQINALTGESTPAEVLETIQKLSAQ